MDTLVGLPINDTFLCNYFNELVNRFFKILPIHEETPESLPSYLQSLQLELLGCKELILAINGDARYVTLLAIIQYLIDNYDCPHKTIRREVFKAIKICQKLQKQYIGIEVVE